MSDANDRKRLRLSGDDDEAAAAESVGRGRSGGERALEAGLTGAAAAAVKAPETGNNDGAKRDMVEFAVEGEVLSVPRADLMAASEYFEHMLGGGFAEANQVCTMPATVYICRSVLFVVHMRFAAFCDAFSQTLGITACLVEEIVLLVTEDCVRCFPPHSFLCAVCSRQVFIMRPSTHHTCRQTHFNVTDMDLATFRALLAYLLPDPEQIKAELDRRASAASDRDREPIAGAGKGTEGRNADNNAEAQGTGEAVCDDGECSRGIAGPIKEEGCCPVHMPVSSPATGPAHDLTSGTDPARSTPEKDLQYGETWGLLSPPSHHVGFGVEEGPDTPADAETTSASPSGGQGRSASTSLNDEVGMVYGMRKSAFLSWFVSKLDLMTVLRLAQGMLSCCFFGFFHTSALYVLFCAGYGYSWLLVYLCAWGPHGNAAALGCVS